MVLEVADGIGLSSVASLLPGVSILAGAFGMLGDISAPEIDDVVEEVNEKFEEFGKKIDARLTETKHYVDSNVASAISNLAKTELFNLQKKWTHCLTFKSNTDVKKCQFTQQQ